MQRHHFGAIFVLAITLTLPVGASAARPSGLMSLDPAQVRVAVTQAFNVALFNGNGGARRVVTSRGTGYNGIWYSKYQWSPDGKYILLVKRTVVPGKAGRVDLLLLNATGAVLRTLASLPTGSDFEPQWANDTNEIAYVAWQKLAANATTPYNVVNGVDVRGVKRFLWGYTSTGEGCGGGTGDPADQVFWQETGLGDVPQSIQWNMSRHIAIYSPSCAGGLALTNLRTQKTRLLGTNGRQWNEAALSRQGILAAAVRTCSQSGGVCTSHITLVTTASGEVRSAGKGELPTWSPDGHTLYFTRRDPGKQYHLKDQLGNKIAVRANTTSIWRANPDGTHTLRLLSEDAFGFGSLQLTPDGRSIIYTRVDNDTGLYTHRLANGRYTAQILKLYGPKEQIERFDSGHRPVVIVPGGGRPAVQP